VFFDVKEQDIDRLWAAAQGFASRFGQGLGEFFFCSGVRPSMSSTRMVGMGSP